MNERKLLTLRFSFRVIRFRRGCRRNGRMRWPRRGHYPAYLEIGGAYARISRQRFSGGFRWIRRNVNLTGCHALFFPDCSNMRTWRILRTSFFLPSGNPFSPLSFVSFFFLSRDPFETDISTELFSFCFRRLEAFPFSHPWFAEF